MGQRGFTLVELLVAIVIMSMLALLSWRAIDGMSRTQALTQQRADALLRMQAALGQWMADLDAVVDTGELQAIDFDGRVLRLTRRDSAESGLSSPGVRVVAWSQLPAAATTQPDGSAVSQAMAPGAAFSWSRWQSPPIRQRNELARAWQRAAEWGRASGAGNGENAPDSADTAIQLIGISQWQLYYHRGETWGNPLSAAGNVSVGGVVTGASGLPNGVRLVLTLAPGQSLNGDLVRDWIRPTLEPGR